MLTVPVLLRTVWGSLITTSDPLCHDHCIFDSDFNSSRHSTEKPCLMQDALTGDSPLDGKGALSNIFLSESKWYTAKRKQKAKVLKVQLLAGSMLKSVEPSMSTSSEEEDVATLSQFESEAEVNEKLDRSHESEEQIKEDIHKETGEFKENDNLGDNHNEEENKSEDSASDKGRRSRRRSSR
ncbi:hypothetical protein AVEN_83999-1 [Araneus ventricosus]|uniref:Uncharacterized protein n=1 Tax=Araneus ventricosus TaxID=182803 RepID=A0A4Y2BSS9_ARAVE|nr:hypothetical protein AVEN_83999-1 [Araneus ventricosus]